MSTDRSDIVNREQGVDGKKAQGPALCLQLKHHLQESCPPRLPHRQLHEDDPEEGVHHSCMEET